MYSVFYSIMTLKAVSASWCNFCDIEWIHTWYLNSHTLTWTLFLPTVQLQAHIYQTPLGIIDEGQSVSLTCDFSGSPAPYKYKWLLNSKFLTTGYSYDILQATRQNEGWYTCEIESHIDQDKYSSYLSLRCKPIILLSIFYSKTVITVLTLQIFSIESFAVNLWLIFQGIKFCHNQSVLYVCEV